MKKIVPLAMLCFVTGIMSAQFGTSAVPNPPSTGAIVFKYDDAGNQIYRGNECADCAADGNLITDAGHATDTAPPSFSEETFWNEIDIYPVPVRDILTVAWSVEVNDLISEVHLYEQNTVHWKFQQVNLPGINRQIQIDMTHYYMGVYVLVFQLKDGRMVSKNITKF